MQKHIELEVSAREERGKNAARRLRASGQVPATLYGLDQEPASLALDSKAMVRILTSRTDRNRVLDLRGGATGAAMAADWQSDPVTGKLLHVDMKRIDLNAKAKMSVPLVTKGVAYGVKTEGGLEDVILREITLLCLPEDAPENIEIDVTELRAGESVRVRDLPLGDKYEVIAKPETTILRIIGKAATEEGMADGDDEEAAVEGAEGEGAAEEGGKEE